jgi:hypothetical protein
MTSLALAEAPSSSPQPRWQDQELGRTWYSLSGESRSRLVDRWTYNLNERGVITGQEFLDLARPIDRATFEQLMRSRGTDASAKMDQLYKDYISKLTTQAFAVLRLNRILDQEAMKRRYSPGASYSRGYYVMRSVLVENAISGDKVPTHMEQPLTIATWPEKPKPADPIKVPSVEMSQYSDDQLYSWLKEAVADRPVRFNIDWSYTQGGMQGLRQYLIQNEVEWPSVTLSFTKLPETAKEFQNQILAKLQPYWLSRVRSEVWMKLVRLYQDRNLLTLPSKRITDKDLTELYGALKETAFKVQASDAAVTDLVISGAKATDFKTRYLALLEERQNNLLQELFGDGSSGTTAPPSTPEEQAKLRARILEIREKVPAEILEAAKKEYTDAIAHGELQLASSARTLHSDGASPLPTDDSTGSQQLRAAFNPMFESMALLPHFDLADADGTVRLMFLRAITPGESSYLPITDARVDRILRSRIQNRKDTYVFREVAYDLFKYNPFQIAVDTCSDAAWSSCLEKDPAKLAEALFPETLMPGQTLGTGADGQVLTSTIFHSELLDRVAEISTDLFSKVMSVPDSHRE